MSSPWTSSLQVDNLISEWGSRRGTGDGRCKLQPGGYPRGGEACTVPLSLHYWRARDHQNEVPAPRVFCRLLQAWLRLCSGLFRLGGCPRDAPRRSDSDKLPLDSTDSTVTCQRPLSVWPLSAVHLPAAVQLLVHRDMIGVVSQPASQSAFWRRDCER